MSMGQVCLIVLAVVVGLAMILYLSCLLLFRTGTETAFHFAEPELTLKPSSNPTVMAMCAMLEQGTQWAEEQSFQTVHIRSRDGLTLAGHWLPCADARRTVVLFHGWKGNWKEHLVVLGSFLQAQRCSLLFVEQRAHGESEGKYLGFGVLERYDCLEWVRWLQDNTPKGRPIYLMGGSLGATTVLMTSGFDLPEQVHGIVADCGYSAPSAILKSVIRSAHLPVFPVYALLRLGCRLFGGFDPEEASAAGAMARCDTPVLFLHGEDDRFVPCAMGRENYACCRAADKTLLTFPAAGHGMSYMADRERYLAAVTDFLGRVFGEEYGTKTTHTFGI